MNPQQQREEARRRRQVNRSVTQHRQSYFDDVRRGVVTTPGTALGRVLPRGPMNAKPEPLTGPAMIDSPMTTSVLKTGIVVVMLGLLAQFHAPLATALLSLVPGFVG